MLQNYTKKGREQNLLSTYSFPLCIFSAQATDETASERAERVGNQSDELVLTAYLSDLNESVKNFHKLGSNLS